MTESKAPAKGADEGQAQVDKAVAKEVEQGYHGVRVDPIPNEAYTLTTGPDSPPHVEDDATRVGQVHATKDVK